MRLTPLIGAGLAVLLGVTGAQAQQTREVTVTPRTVVPIEARLRFTTMVILPEGEEILDVICGDKDFWIVSGAQNFAYIKPAKERASTNLNLVTASGTVYSFLLTEGSATPDLKVFVVPDGPLNAATPRPRLYSETDLTRVRQEAEQAQQHATAARERSEAATRASEDSLLRFRASYPTTLQFPYTFKTNGKPFHVSAIYHDGKCTYIRLAATELPAVYELKDGAANLVNVQIENGVLVVPKVLEDGYLAIGKQRFFFNQRVR